MGAALILLTALLIVGGTLYLFHRHDERSHALDGEENPESPNMGAESDDSGCCGMHITCERDSLLTAVAQGVEYYDDEELDRFKDRTPDSYSDEETEEWRDVLLTLRPDDIAGWARSIQLRGLNMPSGVRDELLMIVTEERAGRNITENEKR